MALQKLITGTGIPADRVGYGECSRYPYGSGTFWSCKSRVGLGRPKRLTRKALLWTQKWEAIDTAYGTLLHPSYKMLCLFTWSKMRKLLRSLPNLHSCACYTSLSCNDRTVINRLRVKFGSTVEGVLYYSSAPSSIKCLVCESKTHKIKRRIIDSAHTYPWNATLYSQLNLKRLRLSLAVEPIKLVYQLGRSHICATPDLDLLVRFADLHGEKQLLPPSTRPGL